MRRRRRVRAIFLIGILACVLAGRASASGATSPTAYLKFNGTDSRVEVPSNAAFSLGVAGLTIAVWMRPDSLTFSKTEGSLPSQQYVHWFGKGEDSQQEWTFRMYSLTQPGPRANRISFYVFKPEGGRGCGSYFQDPIQPGEWIFVTGVVDRAATQVSIYKNGRLRHSDSYASLTPGPQGGSAPLRIGTKDLESYFNGAIGPIWVWNRPLSANEIEALYSSSTIPRDGLRAQYLMNEASGTTIQDSVGGHSGTISGAVWGEGGGPIGVSTGHSGGGC